MAAVAGIDDLDQVSYQTVGPTFGRQVTESAVRALIVFFIVVSLFLWWRLEWRMALAAVVEVLHDLVLTAGIYALVGFEVTPATVIAVLTILGYSLYDTVVVFDKIHENIAERGERHTISAIVNMSVNQVLMRSINTSLTTLLPVGSLLFVGSLLLGAADPARVRPGPVRRGRRRHLLLDVPGLAAGGDVEGARGALAARPAAPRAQERRGRVRRPRAGDGRRGRKRPPSCRPPPGRCPARRASAAATAEAHCPPGPAGVPARPVVQSRDGRCGSTVDPAPPSSGGGRVTGR